MQEICQEREGGREPEIMKDTERETEREASEIFGI